MSILRGGKGECRSRRNGGLLASRFIMRGATKFHGESGRQSGRFRANSVCFFGRCANFINGDFMVAETKSRGRCSVERTHRNGGLGRTRRFIACRQIDSLLNSADAIVAASGGMTASERYSPGLLTPRHPSHLYGLFVERNRLVSRSAGSSGREAATERVAHRFGAVATQSCGSIESKIFAQPDATLIAISTQRDSSCRSF